MKIDLEKELPALIDAGIISLESADRIRDFYKKESQDIGGNRLFIVFGVIGAILVGLGIILIIAHNWDDLSRTTKSLFAFIPLIAGQIFCFYALIKKNDSPGWRESSSTFLFFAVGASISLVSQIYNIPGNFTGFVTIWMLLCLPLVYIMRSSLTSLLYLIGITAYGCQEGYFNYPNEEPYFYCLMFLLIIPHYILLIKNKIKSNFTSFHNWFIPLSLIIVLGTFAGKYEELMFIAYFSLFGIIFSIGSFKKFNSLRLINNGLLVLGSVGSIVLLIMLSFDWFWMELDRETFSNTGFINSPEFISSALFTIIALASIWLRRKEAGYRFDPKELIPIAFLIIYFIGFATPFFAIVLINLLLFILGVSTISKGVRLDHLGILNYGLLIISALIVSRFFDTDISFVIRGLLFVIVGLGFFVANYWLLKKRKSQTSLK